LQGRSPHAQLGGDDSLLTQNGDWQVGIDFFLTQDAKALLVVLSGAEPSRVVEAQAND